MLGKGGKVRDAGDRGESEACWGRERRTVNYRKGREGLLEEGERLKFAGEGEEEEIGAPGEWRCRRPLINRPSLDRYLRCCLPAGPARLSEARRGESRRAPVHLAVTSHTLAADPGLSAHQRHVIRAWASQPASHSDANLPPYS